MAKYKIKSTRFISRQILLLCIHPKHNRDRIEFVAGQYAAISYRSRGRYSAMRCFSIVSSPNHTDELWFAIRVDGDFTTTLAGQKIGSSILLRGPFGNFVIDDQYDRNVIMLAGGIGVTPFMSMILDSAEIKRPNRLTLLYSNTTQNDVAFKDSLVELERMNDKFKVAFFISNGDIDKLKGTRALRGRITESRLNQLTGENYNRFTFFICGPQGFINGMKNILEQHGTETDRIVTEEFLVAGKLSDSLLPKDQSARMVYFLSAASLTIGTLLIMGMDLVRAVPKLAVAYSTHQTSNISSQTPSASQSTPSNVAPGSTSPNTSTTTPSSGNSYNSQSSGTPTPTTNSGSVPAPTVYQPPITSVS